MAVFTLQIKPFIIAVVLQGRACDGRFPSVFSSLCFSRGAAREHIEEGAPLMVDHDPFCDIIDFHSEAYFVKRCVPVSQFGLFFSQASSNA